MLRDRPRAGLRRKRGHGVLLIADRRVKFFERFVGEQSLTAADMAGASLLLPFLPLLPKQILLTNLMTDLPEMAIATDRVDAEAVQRPRRWDVKFIRDFMIRFGVLSSVFDFATFGVLFFMLHASPELFRSGWFVESVVSASLVVLVLRTRGPFWRSRASPELTLATMTIVAAAVALPYTPLGPVFGFAPLPPVFLGLMGCRLRLGFALLGSDYDSKPRGPSAKLMCASELVGLG